MSSFKIKVNDDNDSILKISKEMAKKNNLLYIKDFVLRFGFKTAEFKLKIDNKLEGNEAFISNNVMSKLKIPLTCSYNFTITDNELIIGPFIGILIGRRKSQLLRRLGNLQSYIKRYDEIKGAIFGFSLEYVNKEKLEIEGLLYNPIKDIWESCTLPYPAVILKRRNINQEWREYFSALYPDKIYNYKPLDKWDVYERLVQFPNIAKVLPPTTIYNKVDDILNYLNKYKDIYVKPLNGNRGIGIYNMKQFSEFIQVETREAKENVKWKYNNEEFSRFVRDNLEPGKFIIQKALDLKINGKSVDFRIGLDKDQSGNWKNNMFVTRISGDNSIISNVARSMGTVSYPIEALRNLYGMKDEEAKEYEKELLNLAMNIGEQVDNTGLHFGKLALDIAIDNKKTIWLIEVNNKSPNDKIMDQLGDKNKYFEIRLTNMMYAKKLAGFEIDSNKNTIIFNNNNYIESKVRYLLYISIPDKRKSYRKYVKQISNNHKVVGIIKRPKKKGIQIEVEGHINKVQAFIEEIKEGEFVSNIKGVAIEQIPIQDKEKGMTLEKPKEKE